MDRAAAFAEAVRRWGDNAVVGINDNYRKRFHVGEIGQYGLWICRGVGDSWDEAFTKVENLPDGPLPRSHGAKRAPDRT